MSKVKKPNKIVGRVRHFEASIHGSKLKIYLGVCAVQACKVSMLKNHLLIAVQVKVVVHICRDVGVLW